MGSWIEILALYGGFALLAIGVIVGIVSLVRKLSVPGDTKSRIFLGLKLFILVLLALAVFLPQVFITVMRPVFTPFINWSSDLILQSQGRR
jgi:uncharacterized membrane protein YhaH (DUF805 family)